MPGNPSAPEGNHGVLVGGNLIGGGAIAGTEGSGSVQDESESPAGGSAGGTETDRAIIEVDTSTNLGDEDASTAGVISVDTGASGGLLDVSSGVERDVTGGSSAGDSASSGGEGSDSIIEADANLTGDPSVDLTIDPSAGGSLLDADAATDAGTVSQDIALGSGGTSGGDSAESGTTSGDSSNSIIEADADLDLSGGSPSADVAIDPDASGGLLDVNADTEVDVIEQELTSTTGLSIDLGENTVVAESELGSELGISDAPPTSEAEVGLQADVEGIGATEELASDPADGLSTTSSISGL